VWAFLQMWTSEHFFAKKVRFFENDGLSARIRGLMQCGQEERESVFHEFVQTSFLNGSKDLFKQNATAAWRRSRRNGLNKTN